MTTSQPRVIPGVPDGGQWRPFEHGEARVSLTEPPLGRDLIAERHRELEAASFLSAVAHAAIDDPRRTAKRVEWWDTHFVSAEYGAADGEYPQMPDDFTPSRTLGRSLSGHRRTHRMAYRGSGVTLRMPSATSVKAFERETGSTFDVPVSAETPEGTVAGWVRVTRSGPTWSAEAMGFRSGTDPYVAEAVSAVLEARRPTRALSQVGSFLARRQARAHAQGVEPQPIPSTWISSVGYDDTSGTMIMDTTAGHSYGYEVPRSTFDQVIEASSPGSAYNKLVKGSHRVEVTQCGRCGRFASIQSSHTCPVSARPKPSVVPLHNRAARDRALSASSLAAALVTAPNAPPREVGVAPNAAHAPVGVAPTRPARTSALPKVAKGHTLKPGTRNIDLKGQLAAWADAPKDTGPGMYGPRGWTVDAAGNTLGHLTDSTHVPFVYRANPSYMTKRFAENGDVGIVRYAGAGADDADQLLRSVPREALEDRHGNGPSLRSVAAATRRNAGKLEFGGYVCGPDRSDERISTEAVYLFDDSENRNQAIVRARRMGLDFEQVPDECKLVEVPWRPGQKAWRLFWD